MKRQPGFTMIELLVAVAIVAVLAAIAIPNYRDYVIRGQLNEAFATLGAQRVRMEQYFQDQRTYVGACAAGTVAPAMTNTTLFNYACNNLTATTYTLQATGVNSTAGFTFTLDQNNNRATPAVRTGWTASANCWVRKKDGSC